MTFSSLRTPSSHYFQFSKVASTGKFSYNQFSGFLLAPKVTVIVLSASVRHRRRETNRTTSVRDFGASPPALRDGKRYVPPSNNDACFGCHVVFLGFRTRDSNDNRPLPYRSLVPGQRSIAARSVNPGVLCGQKAQGTAYAATGSLVRYGRIPVYCYCPEPISIDPAGTVERNGYILADKLAPSKFSFAFRAHKNGFATNGCNGVALLSLGPSLKLYYRSLSCLFVTRKSRNPIVLQYFPPGNLDVFQTDSICERARQFVRLLQCETRKKNTTTTWICICFFLLTK